MSKIAVILPVRRHSERVKDKMLRPFAGKSLYEICVEKLGEVARINNGHPRLEFFVAAHDRAFWPLVKRYGLKLLHRSKEDAAAERGPILYDYLNRIDHEWVCHMSACTPILEVRTMISFLRSLDYFAHCYPEDSGLVAVTKAARYVWDSSDGVRTNLNAGSGNSKYMHSLFPCANTMYGFKRKAYLAQPYEYWPKDQPHLHIIDDVEAFDVDTEKQFSAAEGIYRSLPR